MHASTLHVYITVITYEVSENIAPHRSQSPHCKLRCALCKWGKSKKLRPASSTRTGCKIHVPARLPDACSEKGRRTFRRLPACGTAWRVQEASLPAGLRGRRGRRLNLIPNAVSLRGLSAFGRAAVQYTPKHGPPHAGAAVPAGCEQEKGATGRPPPRPAVTKLARHVTSQPVEGICRTARTATARHVPPRPRRVYQ